MKAKYNKEDDVLMLEFNRKKIDYAEHSGDVIAHFSPDHEMVLLEILNASKFMKTTSNVFPKNKLKQIFAV